MTDDTEMLRKAYLDLRDVCMRLGELKERCDEPRRSSIEALRARIAGNHLVVWKELERAIVIEWCNATDTPMLFCGVPPKDMPNRGGS